MAGLLAALWGRSYSRPIRRRPRHWRHPDFFDDREIVAQNLSELIIVKSVRERKQIMFDRADAFVDFPGGIGTLEELAEQLTWIQLARHDKPLLIADIGGFLGVHFSP